MYKIRFSSPSIISSSFNSTEIRLAILLMIIYICNQKNKSVSYLKVCYIFSNLTKKNHTDLSLKNYVQIWDPKDIRHSLLQGTNNGLWEMNVNKNRISFSSNKLTEKIFNEVLECEAFTSTREKILDLSSISNAKLDRYKLVW